MLLTIPKPSKYTCPCGSPVKSRNGLLEVKSGQLYIIQEHDNKVRKVPVYVRIYRNRFEHYALISRNQKPENISTFVSLKKCVVQRSDARDNALVVFAHNMEGTKVTFQTIDSQDTENWLFAFNTIHVFSPKGDGFPRILSPSIPRRPFMPSVEEEAD